VPQYTPNGVPRDKCNANGKVIGKKHAEVWHKKFEILNEL
jgi:hypothetical protein